jgi:hypothetical protein
VSPGESIGDVGIGLAEDVRDTPGVAEDADVGPSLAVRCLRRPRSEGEDGKRDRAGGEEDKAGTCHRERV